MIKQKDIKLLWGRAANRCSICRIELTNDLALKAGAIAIGEQAHIVAEEPGGPRGVSRLTPEQRNSYANLILLCPTCHTKVDHREGQSDYSIERLHLLKTEHEEWVRERLSDVDEKQDIALLLYGHLVDALVELLDLPRWNTWVGFAASTHRWPDDLDMRAYEVERSLCTTLWPGRLPELELAMKALGHVTVAAFQLSSDIAEREATTMSRTTSIASPTVHMLTMSSWRSTACGPKHALFFSTRRQLPQIGSLMWFVAISTAAFSFWRGALLSEKRVTLAWSGASISTSTMTTRGPPIGPASNYASKK